MEDLVFLVVGILLLGIFILLVKLCFLRKSAQEIAEAFAQKMTEDTNTLISVSSRDSQMRKLAKEINDQLRLLQKERHRYQLGDLELKEAVTNISHDLRTPLTAISGYLDLLEREDTNDTVRRYLGQIRNRTESLKYLTEELFRYSVVTSIQELHPKSMDIVRALEESLLNFYAAMQEKGIHPQINLPEAPVWLEADSGAVNRVFSNIISNAIKYSDGDFLVVMEETGRVSFTNTANQLSTVSVEKLFDRYFTVEAGCNASGLGLSIAKTLMERMGGSIWAHYEDNRLSIVLEF